MRLRNDASRIAQAGDMDAPLKPALAYEYRPGTATFLLRSARTRTAAVTLPATDAYEPRAEAADLVELPQPRSRQFGSDSDGRKLLCEH